MRPMTRRLGIAAAAVALVSAPMATSARADDPPASIAFELPPNAACAGFGLRVEGTGANLHTTELVSPSGRARAITTGTGYALTFTNLKTGASVLTPANGSAQQTRSNADGSQTVTATGHTALILFPTDTPAGPSTRVYTGRVVFTVDIALNFTVISSAGPYVDICAALS